MQQETHSRAASSRKHMHGQQASKHAFRGSMQQKTHSWATSICPRAACSRKRIHGLQASVPGQHAAGNTFKGSKQQEARSWAATT
eukprot:1160885-Pelagomonas_calceolata.AAC.1